MKLPMYSYTMIMLADMILPIDKYFWSGNLHGPAKGINLITLFFECLETCMVGTEAENL